MAQGHKSPYEIRQQLLQLAFDILREQHLAKAGKEHAESILSAPSTEEVIEEARKLNNFVSATRGDN